MKKFLVEIKNGGIFLQGSETLLPIKEGASFEIKIAPDYLLPMPEPNEEHFALVTGTQLGFRIPGSTIQAHLEILEPLEFVFATGKKTTVNTNIKCRVYKLVDIHNQVNLFRFEVDFSPFEAASLHEAYSKISRNFKSNVQHHNVHVVNRFFVLKTNQKLNEYCNSKNNFI